MMKKVAFVLCAVSMCTGLVLGLLLGIGSGNKLVVHNNSNNTEIEIYSLTAVRVAEGCKNEKPTGVNLLSEFIKAGESFTISRLDDGRYWCSALYFHQSGKSEKSGYVTLSGGTVDWYLFNAQSP